MLFCPKKRGQPLSLPLILFSPSLASIFCNYFPRQRRKSGQDGVDLEGLQAGLEKLAMKPKVLNSKVVWNIKSFLFQLFTDSFVRALRWSWMRMKWRKWRTWPTVKAVLWGGDNSCKNIFFYKIWFFSFLCQVFGDEECPRPWEALNVWTKMSDCIFCTFCESKKINISRYRTNSHNKRIFLFQTEKWCIFVHVITPRVL